MTKQAKPARVEQAKQAKQAKDNWARPDRAQLTTARSSDEDDFVSL